MANPGNPYWPAAGTLLRWSGMTLLLSAALDDAGHPELARRAYQMREEMNTVGENLIFRAKEFGGVDADVLPKVSPYDGMPPLGD